MPHLFDLSGKVAVVTGGSSGLGVQMAKALAHQGADLAIVARRMDKLNKVKEEIESMGVKCLAVQCDVSVVEDIEAAVEQIADHYGKIDILVNNAGIGLTGPAEEQSEELWDRMIEVNLNSVYFFSKEVGKVMLKHNYGRIINIGSIHSQVAMANFPMTAYNVTKGGVALLTKSLANEWAKRGITVNCIGPAYFESEMTDEIVHNKDFQKVVDAYCPMGRIGKAGELDGAIVYFASDASSYTTGQYLAVDGGWTAI